ncbi:hypothetical protein ABBQ38_006709 [Trebouxia sp. C0009 RCD-2024]
MDVGSLPAIPGVCTHGLPDKAWTQQHPQWIQAIVWAAHDAYVQAQKLQRESSTPVQSRCAACTAMIKDASADTRCSRCKKVSFCDQSCQRKAFPVHKHHCQSVQDQHFSSRLQPLLFQAVAAPGNSAKPPFPPSLKRLMEIADTPRTGREQQMSAAYSNLQVARYFLHHADVPQAWTFLDAAVRHGKELKVWSLQNDALLYQVLMCRHLDDQNILQSMVDCCKEGMRLGEKHKDLNLQARASHALGGMEALYNPPEGFRLLQQSREMWSSMLKAGWTWADGNAEDQSIRTCAESLVKVLINIAGSLTTRGKAAESEAVLREALQVCRVLNIMFRNAHRSGACLAKAWKQ